MLQPESTPLPDEITRLALLGWCLFPTYPRSRATPEGAKDRATCDLDQLEAWARDIPGCGWKVHLGRSGLWALDIDTPSKDHEADGRAALARLLAEPGRDFPRTADGKPAVPMLRSGGGGWCLIFAQVIGERIQGAPRRDLLGLDPLRGEQAITVPPTLHHTTGRAYRWINTPWTVAPSPAPRWLFQLYEVPPAPAVPRPTREASGELAERWLMQAVCEIQAAPPGNRNVTLFRRSFAVGRMVADGRIGEGYARVSLYEAAMQTGLDPREATATIDGAIKRARTAPPR